LWLYPMGQILQYRRNVKNVYWSRWYLYNIYIYMYVYI
jgi:hypothetical protein